MDADLATIKKSFRRLAHLFHPDKNPNNTFSGAYFNSLKEAYEVLSNSEKRKAYDKELWLMQKNKPNFNTAITPKSMQESVSRLAAVLVHKKEYSVIESHLTAYLLSLLNDEHIAIFNSKAKEEDYFSFTETVLDLTQLLPAAAFEKIKNRLLLLNDSRKAALELVLQAQRQRKYSDIYRKYKALLIIFLALLFCICMFLFGKD